jgi:hypothetical protein
MDASITTRGLRLLNDQTTASLKNIYHGAPAVSDSQAVEAGGFLFRKSPSPFRIHLNQHLEILASTVILDGLGLG